MKGECLMIVIEKYEKQVFDVYMTSHPNADPNKVRALISQMTQKNFVDIPCVMDNNIRHETEHTTVANVFDWLEQRKPIISSNGTFFKQHAEYLSPTVLFLETLGNERSSEKKLMYQFPKGSAPYVMHYTGQGNIKVIMNSDYGGSGTPLSPFYSMYIPPATTGSAKNMTTTLICCLELLSGNEDPWAKLNGINELYDLIYKVLTTDVSDRKLMVHDRFSTKQVVEYLIKKVNNPTITDIRYLTQFVDGLSDDLKCRLMLAYNLRFVLTQYLSGYVGNIMRYLKAHRLDTNNITKETIQSSGYGVEPPEEIKEDLDFVKQFILDNCLYHYLVNDAEVRATQMERLCVCVTDTDSLMVHFASFLDEFQARVPSYRDSCLIASAFGFRLFIEAIIPKMVEDIANYRGIQDKYYRDKFIFKNEFAFLAMSLFAKKMYSASCFVQEGNPRNIHEIQVTGLSFKKRASAEFLEPIMVDLYDRYVLTPDKIQVGKLLDEYYALRERLMEVVDKDASYHQVMGIKAIESYTKSKTLPKQMRGMIIWNAMFPDEEILPMDRVTVIPVSFELMEKHRNIPLLAKVLELCLVDNPKKKDSYISLPETYKEIPDWLRPGIDKDYCVDKLLSPFKQLLGLFDVMMTDRAGGMYPSRMIFL